MKTINLNSFTRTTRSCTENGVSLNAQVRSFSFIKENVIRKTSVSKVSLRIPTLSKIEIRKINAYIKLLCEHLAPITNKANFVNTLCYIIVSYFIYYLVLDSSFVRNWVSSRRRVNIPLHLYFICNKLVHEVNTDVKSKAGVYGCFVSDLATHPNPGQVIFRLIEGLELDDLCLLLEGTPFYSILNQFNSGKINSTVLDVFKRILDRFDNDSDLLGEISLFYSSFCVCFSKSDGFCAPLYMENPNSTLLHIHKFSGMGLDDEYFIHFSYLDSFADINVESAILFVLNVFRPEISKSFDMISFVNCENSLKISDGQVVLNLSSLTNVDCYKSAFSVEAVVKVKYGFGGEPTGESQLLKTYNKGPVLASGTRSERDNFKNLTRGKERKFSSGANSRPQVRELKFTKPISLFNFLEIK